MPIVTLLLFLGTLFAGAAPDAQNKLYGVGFVPLMQGGDEVEQRIYRAVGDMPEVDQMFSINDGDHMLETLGKLRRQGRKLDFLVIAGHGSKAEPHIGFGAQDLLPGEVDLAKFKAELATVKALLARPNLKPEVRAGAQPKLKELEARVRLLEEVPGVMKPGGVVLVLNCSTLASERGAKFVKDLGKLLLGKDGGRIVASRSDVSLLEVEDLWDRAAHFFKNGGLKDWGQSFIDADWIVGVCPPGLLGEKPVKKPISSKSTKPTTTKKPPVKGGSFVLVETIRGEVPPPGEARDHTISGSITESSFSVRIDMKPPYEGAASLSHSYKKGKLGQTLTPGQIVELQCVSFSSKGGSYQPNLGGNGWWAVEGSVEVLEQGKTFVGTASDGKFYPAGSARTRFKVGKGGTIKIVAVQTGQVWSSSKNWNPVTYIYKFKP